MLFNKGFTLVETLVAGAILSTTVALSVPAVTRMAKTNDLLATSSDLFQAINYAQTQAVEENTLVGLCPSENGKDCSSSASWDKGWMVFEDQVTTEKNPTPVIGEVLGYWQADKDNVAIISSTGGDLEKPIELLRFDGSGLIAKQHYFDYGMRVFAVQNDQCKSGQGQKITVLYTGTVYTDRLDCA